MSHKPKYHNAKPEPTPTIRRYGFPKGISEPFWLFDNDAVLKAHHGYKKAKAGGMEAAVELVSDLALDFLIKIKDKLPVGAICVAPHARESTGDNAIPQVLAAACAMVVHGETESDIVQVTRVFHTGADPMERMSLKPEFEGSVTQGAHYVLVDDVTNMGGTLAELANYILSLGGIIAAVVVLVNAGRVKQLQPSRMVIRKLEKRYENEIEEIFGIIPGALTANEANYLIGFKSVDEIRNRLAKARKETDLRLRSKGIERKG
jgi:hypoxanthine phosphoribosyltransferase